MEANKSRVTFSQSLEPSREADGKGEGQPSTHTHTRAQSHLSFVFPEALGSSITKMPWSSATITTPASVLSAAYACLSWTHRREQPRATVISGWKSDIGVQVRIHSGAQGGSSFIILGDEPAEQVFPVAFHPGCIRSSRDQNPGEVETPFVFHRATLLRVLLGSGELCVSQSS